MVGKLVSKAARDVLQLPSTSTSPTTINVGTFGFMQQIVQTVGISGLWKGNLTRMVQIAPVGSKSFDVPSSVIILSGSGCSISDGDILFSLSFFESL